MIIFHDSTVATYCTTYCSALEPSKMQIHVQCVRFEPYHTRSVMTHCLLVCLTAIAHLMMWGLPETALTRAFHYLCSRPFSCAYSTEPCHYYHSIINVCKDESRTNCFTFRVSINNLQSNDQVNLCLFSLREPVVIGALFTLCM